MKKYVFIILLFAAGIYFLGCGKKQQSLEEMQAPMSIESLTAMSTETKASPEAKAAMAPAMPGASATVAAPAPVPEVSKPTIMEIQTALKNAGNYKGALDGKRGPMTKKAVEEFQRANNLQVDGKVGSKTWGALSKYLNTVSTSEQPKR